MWQSGLYCEEVCLVGPGKVALYEVGCPFKGVRAYYACDPMHFEFGVAEALGELICDDCVDCRERLVGYATAK